MEITQFLSQVWIITHEGSTHGLCATKDIRTRSISINHTTTVRGLRSSVKIIATHILSGKDLLAIINIVEARMAFH